MTLPKVGRPSGLTNLTPKLRDRLRDKPEMVRMTLDMPVEAHVRRLMVDVLRDMVSPFPRIERRGFRARRHGAAPCRPT